MTCRIEEYTEESWNCSKVSTVTCGNNHLSFTMVIVVYVPYERLLHYPTICWVDFTKSAIIRKSGSEFLHITEVIILDQQVFQDQ